MIALREFEDFGLHVGWLTALLGWDGPAENPRQIDERQVVELAVSKLSHVPGLAGDELELASLSGQESGEVDRLLRRLALQDSSSEELELRKWRFLLLQKLLAALPEDPLYAWFALSDLWHSFGFPADCPESVRGFEKIPPGERYSTWVQERLLSDHQKWLEAERSAILAAEAT